MKGSHLAGALALSKRPLPGMSPDNIGRAVPPVNEGRASRQ
jgi:hypothetical protein